MRAAREGAPGATMVAGEYVEGVIAGKAFSIREWQIRREKREFAELVEVLRVAQWRRAHPELVAEYNRRTNARPGVRERNEALRKQRRAKHYRKNPLVFSCQQCGSQWCKAPWIRGPHPEFCDENCRYRYRYAHDEDFRNRARANSAKQHARKSQ
jgi:ribosomal protein L44E